MLSVMTSSRTMCVLCMAALLALPAADGAGGARIVADGADRVATLAVPDAEILWRAVTMEDGSIVLLRDQLDFSDGAHVLRHAFLVHNDRVVADVELDSEREPIAQISLHMRVAPLTGLGPASPVDVMTVMAWLELPPEERYPKRAPDKADDPRQYIGQWAQVDIGAGQIVVVWTRETEFGDPVRDAFLIERQAVTRHVFLSASEDIGYAVASRFAAFDTADSPRPATEVNILIVLDYLDPWDRIISASEPFPDVFMDSNQGFPGDTGPHTFVSPSGGIGGP